MSSDRIKSQIDALLDAASQAFAAREWETLREHCDSVLRLDPDNSDARHFLDAANRDTGVFAEPSDQPASSPQVQPDIAPAGMMPPPSPPSLAGLSLDEEAKLNEAWSPEGPPGGSHGEQSRFAISKLREAARREPSEWVYQYMLADHLHRDGQLVEAVEAARAASAAEPSDPRGAYALATMMRALTSAKYSRPEFRPLRAKAASFYERIGMPFDPDAAQGALSRLGMTVDGAAIAALAAYQDAIERGVRPGELALVTDSQRAVAEEFPEAHRSLVGELSTRAARQERRGAVSSGSRRPPPSLFLALFVVGSAVVFFVAGWLVGSTQSSDAPFSRVIDTFDAQSPERLVGPRPGTYIADAYYQAGTSDCTVLPPSDSWTDVLQFTISEARTVEFVQLSNGQRNSGSMALNGRFRVTSSFPETYYGWLLHDGSGYALNTFGSPSLEGTCEDVWSVAWIVRD